MKKLDLRLLRLLRDTKGQFTAITSLIIIGLTVYISMSMAAVNLDTTLNEYYEITNFADIYAEVVRIPESEIQNLKDIKGVLQVQGRVVTDVPLKVEDAEEKVTVRIKSVPEHPSPINGLYPFKGESSNLEDKEILVVKQFALARGIKIGQILYPQIGGKRYSMKVSGIVSSPEHIYMMKNEQNLLPEHEKFGVLYLSEPFAQFAAGYSNSYNQVLIKVDSDANIEKIKEQIEEALESYGVRRVYTSKEQLSNRMVSEEIRQLRRTSTAIPLLFLSIAAVIISVMLGRMVKQDRTTIGIFKALGYSDYQVMFHYSKYSMLIGVTGALTGSVFGMLLSGLMTKMYVQFFNIPMLGINFYYQYILLALLLTSVFCIGAGLVGAKGVLKIMPAESMKPEPPKTGGKILLEKFKIFWKQLNFYWKMVLRNVFRNKKRFIFIVMGIALTYGMVLLTLHLNTIATKLFDVHYTEFQRMDYNINFSKPLNERVVKDIKNIVEVEHIEPKVEYPFKLINGWKNKVVNIIGVRKDTKFYSFINKEGKAISLPDKGLVVSENLSRLLEINKGDTIKIETYIPGKDDVNVVVKDVIQQNLGMNAYMEIDEMRKLLLEKEMITGVYLDSRDSVKAKLDDVKNISSIESTQDMIETFEKFLDLSIFSIGIMLLFSGILGFAIVYNSAVINISERILEFSTLRVLGFTKREVFGILLKENFIMTVMGIIGGIPLGRYMIIQMERVFSTELYAFSFPTSFRTYISAVVITVIFSGVAQFATLNKITRLNLIDALKNRLS